MAEAKRKGARSIKEIPKDVLEQLNRGDIETANLVEFLGIDARILLETVLTQHDRKQYLKPILEQIDQLNKHTFVTINETIGVGLYEQTTLHKDSDFLPAITSHKSDLVRSWATVLVGRNATLCIEQTLENIRPFASEATRPRGVWCEHIVALKENPALGLPILEPLMWDNSKYVQNSVGNWLNDASKTQPEFVKNLCADWAMESDTKETKYIIKRALRTIEKSYK